jgi:hypothetical protein
MRAKPSMRRPIFAHVLPLMTAVVLAGCSDSGTDEVAIVATRDPVPPSADACDLLSSKDAGEIIGGIVGDPAAGAPLSSETVRLTDCTWMDPTSGRTVRILLRRSETPDNSSGTFANLRAELAAAGPVNEVEGLADGAFWASNQLHVVRGGRDQLTVSVTGFPDAEAPATARKAAEVALGHF